MKTFLNILVCVIVLAVAALVGSGLGFFKVPALDSARNYSMSVVTWAKNGFKGSPGVTNAATSNDQPEAAGPSQAQQELSRLISDSKRRAVAKYPDLAIVNTEMNSRFVFRYTRMTKENDARLQEPNWPETLADDCAAASKVHAKPTSDRGPVPVSSKKMVATSAR